MIRWIFPLILIWICACSPKTGKVTIESPAISKDTLIDLPTGEEDFEIVFERQMPDTVMYFRQSGCFGQCPVFEVIFLSDSTVHFHGKRHVQPLGVYSQTLSAEQMEEVSNWKSRFDLLQCAGMHPPDNQDWIPDLPSSTTMVRHEYEMIVIRHNHSGPESYRNFEKYMRSWTALIDWELD